MNVIPTTLPGVMFIDGEIEFAVHTDPAADPVHMLRLATAAAAREVRIGALRHPAIRHPAHDTA